MHDVLGRKIDLPDGRLVFFAATDDRYYIGFRNECGEDTKLTLSREAKDALSALLSDPTVGAPLAPFPSGGGPVMWKLVSVMPTT